MIHQTTNGGSPVAVTLLGEAGIRPYGYISYNTFRDRISYLAQIMVAHQFSPGFDLQITPTYVSNNSQTTLAPSPELRYMSILAAARIKISKPMGLIIDYAHPFSSFRNTGNGFYDPLGIGLEIETGGHVFTMNITNAKAIDEINYLNDTQSNFSKGQFRLGFTISRIFDFNHRHKSTEK